MHLSYVNRFLFVVVLPLLAAAAGVAWLTVGLIAQVSTGANLADRGRTAEVVRSALQSAQAQLANTVTDNAYWDDAVANLYATPDAAWVQDSYGVPTEQGINYNLFVIADRALPRATVGALAGQPFQPDLATYFGGKLDGLLDLLPQDWDSAHASVASLMGTTDGLAIVAAAPIFPTSEDFALPAAAPRYMIMARFLTPESVSAIGEQYVIGGLQLDAGISDPGDAMLIYDYEGDPVATVRWQDRRPGDAALRDASRKAAIALSFLGLVLLGVGGYNFMLIRASGRSEERARHDSLHDPLTGLPNRAALNQAIDAAIARGEEAIAVAFADLDGFKEVNDTFDHATGDRLICEVADGLTRLVASRGLVCRLGGDEFVILVTGPGSGENAAFMAQEVINYFARSFDLDGRMAKVGASIGIAHGPSSSLRGPELMRRADIAMYRAKAQGKNRHCIYDPQFDSDRVDDIAIAEELRAHLARGTIAVAYQPIIDAGSGRIAAVEALARWPAESSRRVGPDRFVAVAEQHGLIDDLGATILARACTDAAQWPDVRLSVNISPVQLLNPHFVQRTLDTIRASGIDPHRVEIEITEGVLVSDMADARRCFEALQIEGVHVALDDFGTGFSSIGYLKRIRFDRIKIDRSLVDQIVKGTAQQQLVQGVMMMARGLAAQVTAEGVETRDQAQALRNSGCDELQGYYFFRPMPAEEISELARNCAADPTKVAAVGA